VCSCISNNLLHGKNPPKRDSVDCGREGIGAGLQLH
jgi:hypothetical protein